MIMAIEPGCHKAPTWKPFDPNYLCHDCGAMEGEYHAHGCDMERCPFCLGQLISCGCAYGKLGLDCSPGTRVYEKGLNKEELARWRAIVKEQGRIPYVCIPNLCAICGKRFPRMFHDDKWGFYIPPNLQDEVLCEDCYDEIIKLFPNGWRNARPHKNNFLDEGRHGDM